MTDVAVVADRLPRVTDPMVCPASAVGQPSKQSDRLIEQRLLPRREIIGDRLRQPPFSPAAIRGERHLPPLSQLDRRAPAISGIRMARDESVGLEVGDRLSHRLRPDPLGDREVADTLGPFSVEPAEDRAVREREAVFGA